MDEILQIVGELAKVPGTWQTAGAAAAVLAIVVVLIRVSKLKMVGALLARKKWLRPTVAAVLGFAAGALTAMGQKAPWLQVLTTGVLGAISGLGATGLDQAIRGWTGKGRETDEIGVGVMALVNAASGAEADQQVVEMKAALDDARLKPAGVERRKALAAWGRQYLPPAVAPKPPKDKP